MTKIEGHIPVAEEAHENKNESIGAGEAVEIGKDLNKDNLIAGEVLSKKTNIGSSMDNPEFDAIVHGTAVIVDSLNSQPTNEMYKSIWGIIDSKEHIQRNVGKIRVVNVNSIAVHDSRFRHELQITFTVNSSRLWDSPRCYLWKHLGNSEWKLPDGSRVSFVRIHQSRRLILEHLSSYIIS